MLKLYICNEEWINFIIVDYDKYSMWKQKFIAPLFI